MSKAHIGILGTGDVGRVLASAWLAAGHPVTLGSRSADNEKAATWLSQARAERPGAAAAAGTFADAARAGDVLVIATLWSGTLNAVELAGEANFAGKTVIDTTNPLDFSRGVPPTLAVGTTDSAGEILQRRLPAAHIVKAFNTIGNPHMNKPSFAGGTPDMFIAGDDVGAKAVVTALCAELGWPVVDAGPITSARWLEALAMLWITLYFATGDGNHAFKLLRK